MSRLLLLASLVMCASPKAPAPSTAELLARFDALPDLHALARARAGGDVYQEQDRLRDEHLKAKTAFRTGMPYRSPPRPCSTRTHSIAAMQWTVVDPAQGREGVEIWEDDLHEAREHGASLPDALRKLLERLPR